MTTSAFAQTNTERLTEVVDNTRSANTMLASIQEILTELVSESAEAIAALAATIESIGAALSAEIGAVGAAVGNVDEKVSALDSKVMALDSALMDISTKVSSVGDQVSAFNQRDAQNDDYYTEQIESFAVILPAIKETVDTLAASDDNAALNAISEGIAANTARINEITSSLEMISAQLGTIQEELDIVANTTATSAQARAPLMGPSTGSATLKITPYDIAKNVDDDDESKVTYQFMCEEDIFLQSFARATGTTTPSTMVADDGDAITVRVSGAVSGTLYNSDFSPTGGTDDLTNLDRMVTGNNAPLLANNAITITLTANAAALANVPDFNGGDQIYVESADGGTTAGTEITTILELAANLKENLYTEDGTSGNEQTSLNRVSAQSLTPEIYELTASWISDAEDPKCEFMRTDATTDTSIATLNLTPTDTPNVLNTETKILDCNAVDTTIVSINPIMSGSLREAASLEFTIDGDDAASAKFMFDVNGTHSLVAGYEDALPLDIGTKDLNIESTLSTVTTLILQVEYQSADGNTCIARDPAS